MIGKIRPKVCVTVDNLKYGRTGLVPEPGSPLIAEADSFVIKHPQLLRLYHYSTMGFLFTEDGGNINDLFGGAQCDLISEVAGEHKSVIYHGGHLEDRLLFVESLDQVDQTKNLRGFGLLFLKRGFAKYLNGVEHASFSLGPSSKNLIVDMSTGEWHADIDTKMSKDRFQAFFIRSLKGIRKFYPGPLSFENVPLNSGFARMGWQKYLVAPRFISRLLKEQDDVGFVLDVAHAAVSASRTGMSHKMYMSQLPHKLATELHISGYKTTETKVYEKHSALGDEQYEALRWLFEDKGIAPKFILIEDNQSDEDGVRKGIDDMKEFLLKLGLR